MRSTQIVTLLLLTVAQIDAATIVIVVPGTWSTQETWHTPGGDFFDALEQRAHKCGYAVVPHLWSGKLEYESRVRAAKGLVRLIESYPAETEFFVVAHSHGVNVVNHASQLLHEHSAAVHIEALFALAGPVSELEALPNMAIINYVYNFFSYADIFQTVHGFYQREFPEHERIANLCVTIDGKEPGHRTMRHPTVGKWLLWLHEQTRSPENNGFENFRFGQPGVVHFYRDQPPRYEIDYERDEAREAERRLLFLLTADLGLGRLPLFECSVKHAIDEPV